MPKSKVFYYVESAPQILSAYRHILQKKINEFDMLVRLNGNIINDEQIQLVLKKLELIKSGNIVAHRLGYKLIYTLIRRSLLGKYSEFCIADIRSPVSLFAIILSLSKKFVLLDDGVASITFYKLRQQKEGILIGGTFKRALARFAQARLKDITLHTMMPLNSIDGITVELNEYKFQPSNARIKVGIDEALAVFIGSKVVEEGVCSKEYFENTIKRFVSANIGRRLVYVAHREESLEKFEIFPQLQIVRLPHPLELEYGVVCDIPSCICSFYSAGLVHFLPYRNKIKIIAYGLPIEQSNKKYHQSIKSSKYLFEEVLGIESE